MTKRRVGIKPILAGAALFLVVTLATLEIFSALFFELGLLAFKYRPAAWSSAAAPPLEESWRTEYMPWGSWHKKNATALHRKSCFAETYDSNEVGARDRPFTDLRPGQPRIIGLGDSFMEGYGIALPFRFDSVVESSGFDFLNFGAAGHFGPAQYYLLYEHFSDVYPHDALVIFVSPASDYTDNDPEYWATNRNSYGFRYRPYYRKTSDGGYELFYPVPRPGDEVTFADLEFEGLGFLTGIAKFYRNFTYTYGTIRYGIRIVNDYMSNAGEYSGYYNATEEQLDAVKYFLSKIVERADQKGDIPVIIFSVPTQRDLRVAEGGTAISPSSSMLQSLADSHASVRFVDGLTAMPQAERDTARFFLSCDGHWSKFGHQVAGAIIEAVLREEMGTPPK